MCDFRSALSRVAEDRADQSAQVGAALKAMCEIYDMALEEDLDMAAKLALLQVKKGPINVPILSFQAHSIFAIIARVTEPGYVDVVIFNGGVGCGAERHVKAPAGGELWSHRFPVSRRMSDDEFKLYCQAVLDDEHMDFVDQLTEDMTGEQKDALFKTHMLGTIYDQGESLEAGVLPGSSLYCMDQVVANCTLHNLLMCIRVLAFNLDENANFLSEEEALVWERMMLSVGNSALRIFREQRDIMHDGKSDEEKGLNPVWTKRILKLSNLWGDKNGPCFAKFRTTKPSSPPHRYHKEFHGYRRRGGGQVSARITSATPEQVADEFDLARLVDLDNMAVDLSRKCVQ